MGEENIQQTIYDYKPVGFWKRALAGLIDFIFTMPLMIFIYPIFITLTLQEKSLLPYFLYMILSYGIAIFLIVRFGGSIGKILLKIKIVNAEGRHLSAKQAVLRQTFSVLGTIIFSAKLYNLMYIISPSEIPHGYSEIGRLMSNKVGKYNLLENINLVLIFIDGIWLLFNKRKRALHDYIAGTFVVKKESNKVKNEAQL